MKSLVLLWKDIAEELAVWCRTSTHRDVDYVMDRSKMEGDSFLTITLPSFAKDFELGLERGMVDNTLFLAFRKSGRLPAFLQGFSCLVFDRRTGALLDEPSVTAIYSIRQLTLLFGKIRLDCSQHRVDAAFREFVQCEQEVKDHKGSYDYYRYERLKSVLFGSVFSKMDKLIFDGDIRPKHGPGATADRLVGNQKFTQTTWPCRLETYFPYGEMVLPNWSWYDQLDEVNFLEPGSETPVRVIPVPKTMKTPRLIAVEPTAMQYAQQGLLDVFRRSIRGSLLDVFIGLDDQTPNQRMARQGSLRGDLATLDLSEASDRVSHECVSKLLGSHRHLHDSVMSCRSTNALLPSGEVLTLSKFASMGSALCFPLEASVFLLAIFLGIEEDLGHPLTRGVIKTYLGRVRVFGDDIIVPVEHVRSAIRSLEALGLKVNRRKSFWNGKFRESCGKEYYDGADVSIVRVRRVLPTSRRNEQEIISAVSLRNQLFQAGLERAVSSLDGKLLRILGAFPFVEENSPVLGRLTHDPSLLLGDRKVRNSISVVKGWTIRPVIPHNEIDGWPALRKCLASLENRADNSTWERLTGVNVSKPGHLRRSGRPRAVGIKLGMGPSGYS